MSNYCKHCGASLAKQSKYCPQCGQELLQKKYCLGCGRLLAGNEKFCGKCGKKITHPPITSPFSQQPSKKRKIVTAKTLVVFAVVAITVVAIASASFILIKTETQTNYPYPPANATQSELVDYVLTMINIERQNKGIQNVSLSTVKSGQLHAEDMFKNGYCSHWDTLGYKPYMRYTLAGGNGSVAENVAWSYYSGQIDVGAKIRYLELQMMYNDSSCNWGHRDNILDPSHNRVSIGVVWDTHNVYLVEDFENDYLDWSNRSVSCTQGSNSTIITLQGQSTVNSSIEQISVYYDNPQNLTINDFNKPPYNGSYNIGTYVGTVIPPGYSVNKGMAIHPITWKQQAATFDIVFDVSLAIEHYGRGVYTIYVYNQANDCLTSYSGWY